LIICFVLEGLEISQETLVNILPSVLNKYNITKYLTIDMSPNEAKSGRNNMQLWLNIKNKVTFSRKCSPQVGDSVRTYIKRTTFKQGYEPS
jgi:hypothetical protein